jgi:hypothetical protein
MLVEPGAFRYWLTCLLARLESLFSPPESRLWSLARFGGGRRNVVLGRGKP